MPPLRFLSLTFVCFLVFAFSAALHAQARRAGSSTASPRVRADLLDRRKDINSKIKSAVTRWR